MTQENKFSHSLQLDSAGFINALASRLSISSLECDSVFVKMLTLYIAFDGTIGENLVDGTDNENIKEEVRDMYDEVRAMAYNEASKIIGVEEFEHLKNSFEARVRYLEDIRDDYYKLRQQKYEAMEELKLNSGDTEVIDNQTVVTKLDDRVRKIMN